jgi:hypothetical protein
MTNLQRLKLELSNKDYCTDDEYSLFLDENNLVATSEYIKEENQIKLLETVIAILETLSNDTDLMRKIDSKDIISTDQAIKYLDMRIDNINKKIVELKQEKDEYISSNIRPIFFTR